MFLVFIVFLIILIVIFLSARGGYASFTDVPCKYASYMKWMLPVGLYLLDTFKYSYNTGYDRKLTAAISELYGSRQAVMMLKVHWGNKISLMLLSMLFVFFVGIFTEPDAGYLLFCAAVPAGIAFFSDGDLYEKVKKRRLAIQRDFPDFVNKLTLLINAGMTVPRAWEKIANDSDSQAPLYLELKSAMADIRSGIPEYKAYEEFAKRCRLPVITRFISVILQNIKKGNAELVPILRVFANECWELRKNTAKRYGEEASTKLLLPLMLMFIAILLIVGMPAVLALKNI